MSINFCSLDFPVFWVPVQHMLQQVMNTASGITKTINARCHAHSSSGVLRVSHQLQVRDGIPLRAQMERGHIDIFL